ncbi:DUF4350 domain-containing protein [Salinirubrum litoreum]|uniref:DUF4350 domain-containing protein n=1 Tax=Salinirubrum litoreum TaxID=1126234 RepID=A0ABD5R7Q5_9EURY|nr:DUF4350 domain-containing protein [Salinirubrum litoreum]
MRRRTLLKSVAGVPLAGGLAASATRRIVSAAERIPALAFDSTASLLAADLTPLTDDSVAVVWAEPTAFVVDEDGDGDAVPYPDGTDIPLVAQDGNVVGFGAPIVQNDTDFERGNEEFVLNVLDATAGSGTVLWDESHFQFYDLDAHTAFEGYAEANGYDVRPTDDIVADLSSADTLVVTSPSAAFSSAELDAVASFVADGGTLLLFDQSDFRNFDATDNLNAIADRLDLAFRFNDDQVLDESNNAGIGFVPTTENLNTRFDYFHDREGLGFEIDPAQTYTVDVVDVTDGDTVDVRFAGGNEETIRLLGIDTPEVAAASQFERPEEWEGIESLDYLGTQGDVASEFARGELADETLDVEFDSNEPVRDPFGRLLAYVSYDADGTGSRDTLYNEEVIRAGRARLYDSSFARHDQFFDVEIDARESGRGLWAESAPENTREIRNGPVESVFAPTPAPVVSAAGTLDARRVPLSAEPSASVEGGSAGSRDSDGDLPFVGVDGQVRTAVVGSLLIDESYEQAEDYPVDTSEFGNFAFLTNLIDKLSDRTGDVLIDGGHGQFGVDYGLSAEDAAYYLRYLEGVGIGFEGVNTITRERLDRGRALLVTAPVSAYTEAELDALRQFRDDGGAVVLLAGDAPSAARENLNAVADALCSDLRVGAGAVVDTENNVNDDPAVPTTANVDDWFRLFDAYTGETTYKRTRGGPGRPGCVGRRTAAGNGESGE